MDEVPRKEHTGGIESAGAYFPGLKLRSTRRGYE